MKRFLVWLGLAEHELVDSAGRPVAVWSPPRVPVRELAFAEAVAAFDGDAPTEAVLARYLDRVVGA